MQKNLTNRYIQSITPAPGKRVPVFDTKTTGLCVRVTDTRHTSFYVMTRDPAGKQKWAEIKDGNAPVGSLAKARELAPQGVANLKNGKKAFPRIEAPEVDTYDKVVSRFIAQYAEPRQRTWRQTERTLRSIPWGPRPMAEIAKREGLGASYFACLLRLAFLSPEITTAVLQGDRPADLTSRRLMYGTRFPLVWHEQKLALGFL